MISHKEILLTIGEKSFKADLKIPDKNDGIGIILVHGAIITRKSLSRTSYSIAEYISEKMHAPVIIPDYHVMEKTYTDPSSSIKDISSIIESSKNYLINNYKTNKIFCFGHSMGGILLGDIISEVPDIDAIATYGTPTSLEVDSFILKPLINYLTNKNSNRIINLRHFLWIFDSETRNYLETVMKNGREFQYVDYQWEYYVSFLLEALNILKNYEDKLIQWAKPVLLMFGSNDRLTYFSKRSMPDGFVNKNINVVHIPDGYHITPCREELSEIEKMNSILEFFTNACTC